MARVADELIALDVLVIGEVTTLHATLQERAGIIQRIVGLGLLSHVDSVTLGGRTAIDSAIIGGLQEHFPHGGAADAGREALGDLVSYDCQRLEKECPLPPRKLTVTEMAMRRHAARSSSGYPRSDFGTGH